MKHGFDLANLESSAAYQGLNGGAKFDCMDKKPAPTIRDLYPHLNDEQLAEVEDTWERYLALVLRIFERLESQTDSPVVDLTANTAGIPCNQPDQVG